MEKGVVFRGFKYECRNCGEVFYKNPPVHVMAEVLEETPECPFCEKNGKKTTLMNFHSSFRLFVKAIPEDKIGRIKLIREISQEWLISSSLCRAKFLVEELFSEDGWGELRTAEELFNLPEPEFQEVYG